MGNKSKDIALLSPSYCPAKQRLKTPSPYAASSEDEIFFGNPTDKEINGKNARQVQRWTKTKGGRRKTLNMDTEKWRQRRSLYNLENSIEEEDEGEENQSPDVPNPQVDGLFFKNCETDKQLENLTQKLSVSPLKEIVVDNIANRPTDT